MQEMKRPCALVILAAGRGKRMNSDLPKVLHPIGGASLVVNAMAAGAALSPDRTVIVVGHCGEAVERTVQAYDGSAICVTQEDQLGTGHAVLEAAPAIDGFDGDVIVFYGDTPFIGEATLAQLLAARGSHYIVVLGFKSADPGRYGRVVMADDSLDGILETKDASADELAITLCSFGLMAADSGTLMALLEAVGNDNASGEYYLTDVPAIAARRGLSATAVTCDEAETLGINTRAELANGVTMVAQDTVFFAHDTHLGRDVLVEPNEVFGPGVTVESEATICAFSHLEGYPVGARVAVGPYARLRPGPDLGNDSRVGNFVELKSAEIGEGAKVNYLSYICDIQIGAGSNIGAGTINCNYDGVFKHRTEIGRDVFIGSNTMLVAPVRLGDGAMSGSGSVITSDVPAGDLALGRGKQVNKPGLGARLM